MLNSNKEEEQVRELHTSENVELEFKISVIRIEQILADGKPAVKVSIPNVGVRYYIFPTRSPGLATGQFSDKRIKKPYKEQPNMDASTHQDYLAWMDAFHRVYSS